MSILFVLLMFLLIISISSFRSPKPATQPEVFAKPQPPRIQRDYGFDVPEGYCFHPGHTWALKESGENVRVGVDSFAANLAGKIDRIEAIGPNRWVRQGQKLLTIVSGGNGIELLSPIEGVITAVNHDLMDDPGLLTRDPYKDGWVAMFKSPDVAINQKNLVQDTMVAPWMQNSVARLNSLLTQNAPALAQDGGLPVRGLLNQLTPELRQRVIKEFFLS